MRSARYETSTRRGDWYPQQSMTLVEARAFTLDAAYAGRAEKTLDALEPGKRPTSC